MWGTCDFIAFATEKITIVPKIKFVHKNNLDILAILPIFALPFKNINVQIFIILGRINKSTMPKYRRTNGIYFNYIKNII